MHLSVKNVDLRAVLRLKKTRKSVDIHLAIQANEFIWTWNIFIIYIIKREKKNVMDWQAHRL